MSTAPERFVAERAPFLEYLLSLEASWPVVPLEELVEQAGGPEGVMVLGVDLVEGFCRQGALSSPRVAPVVEPAARILTRARALGVARFLFPCDSHPADSPEFASFPPHCLAGTTEAELVEEIRRLPFASQFQVVAKGSVNALVATDLAERLLAMPDLRTLVVMGDVTDLCLYHLAVNVRYLANARNRPWQVVVPVSAVATYDLPVDSARALGAMPHDGDLLHLVFLYHLQLNGVRVVRDLV